MVPMCDMFEVALSKKKLTSPYQLTGSIPDPDTLTNHMGLDYFPKSGTFSIPPLKIPQV